MEWDLIEWCRKEGGTIYANRPFKTKTGGPDMRSLSNSLSLSSSSDDRVLSLPAAPPLHSVAGYAQKWAFQPHFKAPLKAKPSASYKKQKKRTLTPLSNPIATTEKAFRRHVRGDSGVRGVGEQWLAREVAEHAWGGQWWERRPQ
ncbi:hypothetical protein ES288_A01G073200v1 [Gossypium darwinii]|uniref:Uncharacterized protein n=1 Tax=Gossypium darwinii TaxID=34276 RepID=A0A5D2HIR2_GOSDA|nr:hypothetical protein ES288_A01G073200v1 [Gossypium darwinii]